MRRASALLAVFAALVTACGGKNPSSPSAADSATINGAIVAPGQSSSNSSGAGGGIPGLAVSVNGTDVRATVDGFGRFTLRGVPPGDAELSFNSPSFNGSLGVPAVQANETISLVVSLGDSQVVVESQARTTGSQEQLEGRVEALPPETAALRLVVGGRTVATDSATVFTTHGGPATFTDLEVGQRVHVKGQASGPVLLASSVNIQNTNTDLQIPINGIVSGFTGGLLSFQFTIDGRLIKGDTNTEFFGGSSFADLANGVRAEVKGEQRNNFVYALRIHVNVADDDDDDTGNDESASIEGILNAIGGGVPSLVLDVGGTVVRTNTSTEVQRRGDVQPLTVLQLGMTLHVVGDRQADSSILARKLQIKGDAVGKLFEIEGSMGGVKGSCPTLSFGVNGFDIVTDGGTSFSPACSQLKSGNKVKVNGVVQAGSTVKATSVVRQ
ncbi:MAG TPA: DUF5666 domain-containing protein [Vicinamibacterales bacterium]|nr:DUF5666 domain-containing protein [Vicinamibacterales bacterium]